MVVGFFLVILGGLFNGGFLDGLWVLLVGVWL